MGARLKLDENLPHRAEATLRALRFDVEIAASERLAGPDDDAVLAACVAEGRILVTFDLVVALVRSGVRLMALERTEGQLWVIDEQRVRIRD